MLPALRDVEDRPLSTRAAGERFLVQLSGSLRLCDGRVLDVDGWVS